jgi:hypothetical protein
MRARRHRPMFDFLDARIALDGTIGSGGDAVSGANVGTIMLDDSSSQDDLIGVIDWYSTGTPPNDPTDPGQVPVLYDTSTSS